MDRRLSIKEIVDYYLLREDLVQYKIEDIPVSISTGGKNEFQNGRTTNDGVNCLSLPMCFWNYELIKQEFYKRNQQKNQGESKFYSQLFYNQEIYVITDSWFEQLFKLYSSSKTPEYFAKKYLLVDSARHHIDISRGAFYNKISDNLRIDYVDEKYTPLITFYWPVNIHDIIQYAIEPYLKNNENAFENLKFKEYIDKSKRIRNFSRKKYYLPIKIIASALIWAYDHNERIYKKENNKQKEEDMKMTKEQFFNKYGINPDWIGIGEKVDQYLFK